VLRFAVPGLTQRQAFPRCPGVPRRDVACRVQVGVARAPAGDAPDEGLALPTLPTLPCDAPISRAALTGERTDNPGRHRDRVAGFLSALKDGTSARDPR
jgi:hypothetical protein